MSTLKKQNRIHIRWMIRRDMPEVLHIEDLSFKYTMCEEDFLWCLRQRNCIGMVAEMGETIVGFMIYELYTSKLHIVNLAVLPSMRHGGVGSQMITQLVSKLSSHRRTRVSINVPETNLAAQLFFRTNGFEAINVLRDYYEDRGEDAYHMVYRFREYS
ncbi:ribosomal-protein-alanine N-acetyltransferase RimI [Candidatus Peribacteria bacterium RIFCSPHIGHO2_02_FULL_49_16]|nr:MAG: ribosomal-protein-alanine N-acetyltransferase RimI [Candidatus Peribacteria bacterium RIFCSPHIGHO2_01_FULL_49_38]OGJ58935.1 MAG: ribosomal-protein-alanine N-acetyltransferase RimI [Candidatus Peribacteria bacterium RIFCSPHIGHO2_02_FULL_49_16]